MNTFKIGDFVNTAVDSMVLNTARRQKSKKGPKNPYFANQGKIVDIDNNICFVEMKIKREVITAGFKPDKLLFIRSSANDQLNVHQALEKPAKIENKPVISTPKKVLTVKKIDRRKKAAKIEKKYPVCVQKGKHFVYMF